jgi:hypothetical protein
MILGAGSKNFANLAQFWRSLALGPSFWAIDSPRSTEDTEFPQTNLEIGPLSTFRFS